MDLLQVKGPSKITALLHKISKRFVTVRKLSTLIAAFLIILLSMLQSRAQHVEKPYTERLRPQLHFTPKAHWINDPNGLVYVNGIYHLFYQYYPKAVNWGPMHWGHAISRDLIHWQQKPIALYPDSLGYIFSGSAVYDKENTSGLGSKSNPPMVAIFTHHDPQKADKGLTDAERQSIAFSLDEGKTWSKYRGNPVIQNPGIRDFRDPKVFWYAPLKQWMMVVAASDRVRLYAARDLIHWREISQFGKDQGSHGSVWECPDLFPLQAGKTTKWILTVCEGNGGPNKGSAVQYFIGEFDGQKFSSDQKEARWLEFGPDDYAGNTWNGVQNKRLYIGWMTNLMYAGSLPATTWRGAMTLPRTLSLKLVNGKYYLSQQPVSGLKAQILHQIGYLKLAGGHALSESMPIPPDGTPLLIQLQQKKHPASFELTLTSNLGDTLQVGLDNDNDRYYIKRGAAGDMAFARDMSPVLYAPRIKNASRPRPPVLQLVLDRNSIELFADNGLSVMTALFFPRGYFEKISLNAKSKKDKQQKRLKSAETNLKVFQLKSIWP